jgi:ribosomal protein L22
VAAVEEKQQVRAQAKYVRTSARKARLVTDHIRGRSVPEARTVLAFTTRAVARDIEKVLRSAVANAEANHGLIGDELYVDSAMVDEGPTLKRWRPRARGRVARIRKRSCHITLTLSPVPERPSARRTAVAVIEEPNPKRAPRAPRARKPETQTAQAAAPEQEKPKRRTPVRRKKTEEADS